MKYYNVVSKVQQKIKKFLTRRALRYAIINNHWSKVERTMVLKTARRIASKEEVKFLVPYDIRKIYIREYIRF